MATKLKDWSGRACRNKRQFYSEAECLESIARQKSDLPLRAYQCAICGRWHKTKQVFKIGVECIGAALSRNDGKVV